MTPIPCPENLAWCTAHYSNGNLEDEAHRATPVALNLDEASLHNVQISKGGWCRDDRLTLSWYTDGDTHTSDGLRAVAQKLLAAADHFDAIRDAELLAELDGATVRLPRALVQQLAETLRNQGVGGQSYGA